MKIKAPRLSFIRSVSISQSGFSAVGRTKGGSTLYKAPGTKALFKSGDILRGESRYLHSQGVSKRRSRKAVGI